MPRFMSERNFIEQLESSRDGLVALTDVNTYVLIVILYGGRHGQCFYKPS